MEESPVSLMQRIAILEEKINQLVRTLETTRRDLLAAQAERSRMRDRVNILEAGAQKAAELEEKLAAAEQQLREAEENSGQVVAIEHFEEEKAAREKAESDLSEALERLDRLVERLEGVESDLASLENSPEA
jgi:chromosome segregation ATPase